MTVPRVDGGRMPGQPCAALGSASLRATPGLTPATGRSRRAPRAFKDVQIFLTDSGALGCPVPLDALRLGSA